MDIAPKKGLNGLIENWQSDLIAAFSVSMVALPLALGIAIASDAPPMAGVLSAIIGGIVTTFFKGSHIAINGPAAGLIAVILASIAALDDGSGRALNYTFAAIVVSGAIQIVMGLLKLGRFAELFHSTVVHGILAAIGIIIFIKQIHVALGTNTTTTHILDTLVDVIRQIPNINPFVAIVSLAGLMLLVFHSKISYKFFHFLPAPMWVLLISIPFVYAFNFFEPHTIHFLNKDFAVGPELLINIPDNILDSIAHPDFSKIHTLAFWGSVMSITLIASIESLASAKAIDKLDPYKRKTNLNKDLIGIGISTMISGALGGLPIINVIVRSTVNVHNNAKTKWSNLYHGILLLIFIFLLAHLIQKVPLAALAILLVYTGFKLASPKVFKHVYSQGIEQLIIFSGTLIITLATDLLIGVFGGLLLALITHILLAKVPVRSFFKMIFKSGSELLQNKDGSYKLNIRGIANFLATMKLDKLIQKVPTGAIVSVDFSQARLVDFSILEHFYDFQRTQASTGGEVKITGLEKHSSSSYHKLALKVSHTPVYKLSNRQVALKELAEEKDWKFQLEPADDTAYLESFYFFKTRPVEKIYNSTYSDDEDGGWNIMDIKFEEGAYLALDEYKTTVALLKFPFKIPRFIIEKKVFPQRYLKLWRHRDIDYVLFRNFSKDYIAKVEDKKAMRAFINKELRKLVENNDIIHHLESNGESILLFTDNLMLAHVKDYPQIIAFTGELTNIIRESTRS